MLKMTNQLKLNFSRHTDLYDILIPESNFWRQLNDMIDISFVVDMLKDKYSSAMERTAEDVIRMFKFLLLKSYFKLSDRGLIERTKADMLFKYFLGYNPEEIKLIDSSLLTVFRRERLIDNDENLMDKLIEKPVELALEKGFIEVKNKIIVDSTHTNAMFSQISPREELIRQAKNLKESVYKIDETMHDKMPKKHESTGLLEDQIQYTKESLNLLTGDGRFEKLPNIKEQIDYMETEEFKELYSERYKIEAKNAEEQIKEKFDFILGIDDGIIIDGKEYITVKDHLYDIVVGDKIKIGSTIYITRAYFLISNDKKEFLCYNKIPYIVRKKLDIVEMGGIH